MVFLTHEKQGEVKGQPIGVCQTGGCEEVRQMEVRLKAGTHYARRSVFTEESIAGEARS